MSVPRVSTSLLLLLGACSMLAPMAMNMHLPAMGAIAQSLDIDRASASLTVTVYLWVFGSSMLLIGWPADRFGRRATLMAGLALVSVGAALASRGQDLVTVLVGRAVEALGAAAIVVVPRTMINDRAQGPEAVRLLGMLGTITAAAPALSPVIGEILTQGFGWRMIFVVQATLAVGFLLWSTWSLPETRGSDSEQAAGHHDVAPRAVRDVVAPVLVMAILTALYFAFLAAGADALMLHFQAKSAMLAGLLATLSSIYVLGSMTVTRLARMWHPAKILRLGTLFSGLSVVTMVVTTQMNFYAVAAGMCIYAFGNGLVMPTALAMAGGVEGRLRARVMSVASSAPFLMGGVFASAAVAFDLTTWPRFQWLMGVTIVGALLVAWFAPMGDGAARRAAA